MRNAFRSRFRWIFMLAIAALMVVPFAAFASDVDVAVVDVTVPASGVSLAPGASGPITINLSVSGNQVGTATFEVYRNWTLSGGTFTGSNPQEFTVGPRAGGDPATTFSTSGTVAVAAGQTAGTFTLAATVFDITNTNATGAKLVAGDPSNYQVTVSAPADTTPPVISKVVMGTLGNNGWYTSDVSVDWTVSDPDSAISSQSGCDDFSVTSDQAATTYTCTATSAGGTSSQSVTIKRDATAPTISGSASPAANGAGWNNTDVNVSFTCGDNLSGVASCGPNQTLSSNGAGQSATGTAVDSAGNSASATVSGISIDKTAPTATASASPAPNGNGWNNTDVTVSFSGSDGLSGIAGCDPSVVLSGEGANQSASGTCTDKAGNVSALATKSGINIDKTNPIVSLVGGPVDGASYYFGSVPAAPTCNASDALSGLDGNCSVSGYGTTVGSHTVTTSATDKASNSASASANYTVLAWTISGFFQPVDMGILNNAKAGSTVPLKFKVFAGPTELTSTSVVQTFTQKISCASGTGDDIEQYATGSTSLRYDTTGGQFIFNWQTLKTANTCYRVTMTTQDGSSISADFRLK
jgi:hypothetical protein